MRDPDDYMKGTDMGDILHALNAEYDLINKQISTLMARRNVLDHAISSWKDIKRRKDQANETEEKETR